MFIVLTMACSSGGGSSAQTDVTRERTPEPLVAADAHALLELSADRSLAAKTFRGHLDTTVTSSKGKSFEMDAEYAFGEGDGFYMDMEVLAERVEVLIAPSGEVFGRFNSQGWYLMPDDSVEVDTEAFEQYLEQRGIVDLESLSQFVRDVRQRENETIDGVEYIRVDGTLDLTDFYAGLDGMLDTATLEQISDVMDEVQLSYWINAGTYLPYRMDMGMDYEVEGDAFSVDLAMTFEDFDESVDVPDVPEDAEELPGNEPFDEVEGGLFG
jgi:hypothetical protein